MLFFRKKISSKLLSEYKPNSSVENKFIEINLRTKKCHRSWSYNPNLTLLNSHIQNKSRDIGFCATCNLKHVLKACKT